VQHPFWGDVSPSTRCHRQRAFQTAGDSTFLDFLMPKHGPKEPSLMALAALLVGVAQLIIALRPSAASRPRPARKHPPTTPDAPQAA
jgi:hypothetical protein